MTIEKHSNESQTQWDRGNFKAMILSTTSDRPIGFCDGTAADEAEIVETAANEGTEVSIEKKLLKSGREVWTVRAIDADSPTDDDGF